MKHIHLIRPLIITIAILSLPVIGMQISSEVDWGILDFFIMGTLIYSTGLAFEFISSREKSTAYHIAVGVGLLGALSLVWVNLAVGMIGNEDTMANALYLGVLAVGGVGGIVARFKPRAMAKVMWIVTATHIGATVIGLGMWWPREVTMDTWNAVIRTGGATTIFLMFWVWSAVMFEQSSIKRASGHRAEKANG